MGLWILSLPESLSEVNHDDPVCTFGGPASTCVGLETEKEQTLPAPAPFPKDSSEQATP